MAKLCQPVSLITCVNACTCSPKTARPGRAARPAHICAAVLLEISTLAAAWEFGRGPGSQRGSTQEMGKKALPGILMLWFIASCRHSGPCGNVSASIKCPALSPALAHCQALAGHSLSYPGMALLMYCIQLGVFHALASQCAARMADPGCKSRHASVSSLCA